VILSIRKETQMIRVLLAGLLVASCAVAGIAADESSFDCPGGVTTAEPVPAPIFTDSDECPYETAYTSPVVRIPEHASGNPGQDWSYDVLVFSGRTGSGQCFDVDETTGDIYAIFDTNHSAPDTACVYRSQDSGVTWSFWRRSYSSASSINTPKIRVVKDSSGQSYVCMFFMVGNTLRMRYMTPDQTTSAWTTVTASDVLSYDVDGEVGNNSWVYAVYVKDASGNDIYATRLSLDNFNWVNDTRLFVDPGVNPCPSIAAGADSTVIVSFCDTRITANTEIRIKRSTNHAATWISSVQISNNTAGYSISETSTALGHNAASPAGWILSTFGGTSTGSNVGFYYTSDAGSTWTYGDIMAGTDDQHLPDIRANKVTNDDSAVTLAFIDEPEDAVMFAFSFAAIPNTFMSLTQVNQFDATGYWPPAAGWAGLSSAVLYTSFAQGYNAYFDWFGNTANEEETSAVVNSTSEVTVSPNPFSESAAIRFSVAGAEPVSISVYSISGRLVKTLVNDEILDGGEHTVQWNGTGFSGEHVAPGVYLCRFTAGASSSVSRMVITY
jgi:hypothetical protein